VLAHGFCPNRLTHYSHEVLVKYLPAAVALRNSLEHLRSVLRHAKVVNLPSRRDRRPKVPELLKNHIHFADIVRRSCPYDPSVAGCAWRRPTSYRARKGNTWVTPFQSLFNFGKEGLRHRTFCPIVVQVPRLHSRQGTRCA
jgi:hypothetical protein